MKKLTELNRKLENVNSEFEMQAESYVLKMAYEMNKADIVKAIDKLKFESINGEKYERVLSESELDQLADLESEKANYDSGIVEMTEKIGSTDFTDYDKRRLYIVACGNRDNCKESGIRFGKPFYKIGDTKHERLLGFTALSNAVEYYLDCVRNESRNTKKGLENLKTCLNSFMNWNYCTNNASADMHMHTIAFESGLNFEITVKFAKYIASLGSFELKIGKSESGHVLTEKFSQNTFYQSLCAWLYIQATQGNKFDTRYTAPCIMKDADKTGKAHNSVKPEKPEKDIKPESEPEKPTTEKVA